MSLNPGVTNPPPTNNGNSAVLVIGFSVAVVVMLAIVSVLVYCLWKRKRRDAANAKSTTSVPDILDSASDNEAPEESAQPAGRNPQQNRELPPVPAEESIYEEPADYSQLDNSKRVPIDDNYQPLKVHYSKLHRSLNEDDPENDGPQKHEYVTVK